MKSENYALITGASEGFGKALALECASRNMNVILVALPGSGLEKLTSYIERNFPVKAVFFEHDLSRKEECQRLYRTIVQAGLSINVLINNAGIGGTYFFKEKDAEYYYRQIELNVGAPTLLTHLFLDELQQNSHSYILNVSSLASFFYLPKKQVYGGTKSYLISFSKSLRRELKQKNIHVSAVCPGGMNTTPVLFLQNHTGPIVGQWSVMNPEDVAKIAIDGMLKKKEIIIPGVLNRLFLLLDKIIPKQVKELLTDWQMRKNKSFTSPIITSTYQPLKKAV